MTSPRFKTLALVSALSISSLAVFQGGARAGWDDGGTGEGGQTCVVTSTVDDVLELNSLRCKVESGYNANNGLCVKKIVLRNDVNLTAPLVIDNAADGDGVIIEGEGGVRTISVDGDCGLRFKSDRITLRNVRIRGSNGAAICIESGFNRIEGAVVEGNQTGILLEGGANVVTDSVFRNNAGDAVSLVNGHNEITRNSFYGNGGLAVDSPNADIQPTLNSVFRTSDTEFTAYVSVPSDVQRVELYRTYPAEGGTDTFIASTTEFLSRTATLSFAGKNGDSVYALAFLNGSTSAVSDAVTLSDSGGGNGGGNGSTLSCASGPIAPGTVIQRTCAPGFGSPPLQDSDCDGIKDNQEDKNKNCLWNPEDGESDAANSDSDGDGLNDGKEDRNKDGAYDAATETNALEGDTDGDTIPDGVEDKNKNGFLNSDESDPTSRDSDCDGLADNLEDKDRDGNYDGPTSGETKAYHPDTDLDALDDGVEDANRNGSVEPWESNPNIKDTDGDHLPDASDACPNDGDLSCVAPCVPHAQGGFALRTSDAPSTKSFTLGKAKLSRAVWSFPVLSVVAAGACEPLPPAEDPETYPNLDTDYDGLLDYEEDYNGNCVQDAGETNPRRSDSDADGINDRYDPCPTDAAADCVSQCTAGAVIPSDYDADADGLPNVLEDVNGNCARDGAETDAYDADTDGDGITDGVEKVGGSDPNRVDTDKDGLSDGEEDVNKDGVAQPWETDAKKPDTDGDGADDVLDACPLISDETCTKECHVGEVPHELKDSDRDGLPDRLEDANHDCVRQFGETDAFVADTDGDGLADGVEDYNRTGAIDSGETDPRNPDTDRDGIVDGKEDRNGNRLVDFMECSPLNTDSDGDGLPDALEDRNLNGTVDTGETSCALDDTDGDGIADGAEDANRNGRVDYLECDPALVDTDGDGISDTLEDANLDGVFDAAETSCYLTDSDFDGLADGSEDANHNGIVEPGESDPAVPDSDGDGAQDGVDPRPIFSSSGDLKKAEGRGGCSLIR